MPQLHYLKLFSIILFLGFFSTQGYSSENCELIIYPVYKIDKNPSQDKMLDKIQWNKFPAATDFFIYGQPEQLCSEQTIFRICWSDDALYIYADCQESDTAGIMCKEIDGGKLWTEDSVEIFLGKNGRIEQFIISAAGKRYWNHHQGMENDIAVSCEIKKQNWLMNVKIPWKIIGGKPEPEEMWHLNVARNNKTVKAISEHLSSWQPVISSFHSSMNSSPRICFHSKSITVEEAWHISGNIRQQHLAGIIERIKKNAKLSKFYLSSIADKLPPGKLSAIESELRKSDTILKGKNYDDMNELSSLSNSIAVIKDELLKIALTAIVNN